MVRQSVLFDQRIHCYSAKNVHFNGALLHIWILNLVYYKWEHTIPPTSPKRTLPLSPAKSPQYMSSALKHFPFKIIFEFRQKENSTRKSTIITPPTFFQSFQSRPTHAHQAHVMHSYATQTSPLLDCKTETQFTFFTPMLNRTGG